MIGHAVVIGGSLAGLVAARALATHAGRVTVLERDRFPDGPAFRGGVPQSRHLHLLLASGQRDLERLFPGMLADLERAGAVPVAMPEMLWMTKAGWNRRFPDPKRLLPCRRELIDFHVRGRLAALPNVEIRPGREVVGLLAGGGAVTGVRLRDGSGSEQVPADLVIDASGRSGRAPAWLAEHGFPAPAQARIDAGIGYASRYYAIPPGHAAGWQAIYLQAAPPEHARMGGLFPVDPEHWIVTLGGAGGDIPPTDEAGFLAFAASLRHPVLHEAIRDARPAGPIHGFRHTANQRRRYERGRGMPEGYVVVGDAACAFNPIYGQGMSVAARTALALHRSLTDRPEPAGLARRLQRQVARANADAWLIATGEDLRYPATTGAELDRATRLQHGYLDRVLAVAAVDPRMHAAFTDVLHLVAPASSLQRPAVVLRALRGPRVPAPTGLPAPEPQPAPRGAPLAGSTR